MQVRACENKFASFCRYYRMLDKTYMIRLHATSLKLKAALKYNISPEKCHIGHLVLQGLLDRPNSLNQIDAATDGRETNISVARRSCRLASAMQKCGLRAGDCVVLMGYNHLDLVIPFYACHFNGYSVCNIDPSCAPVDLQVLFPNINPKLVFCQKSCEDKVKEAFMVNNLKGEIVFFDDKDTDLEAFIRQYKGTETNFRPAEFDHSKTNAWLMLTSGTTGLPKVVVVPYDTLLNAICCWFEPFTDKFEIVLTISSIQWMSGGIYFIGGPLRCYTRLQSSLPLTPQSIVAYINKYKPNTTTWTPCLLGQFLGAAENGSCDLSSFKTIGIGGASIEKPLLHRVKKICQAYLYLVYSMTELMVPVFDFDEDTPEKSSGYPKDKYQFKIAPLQMEEVIKRHPGVDDACVVGIPDTSTMEIPIAAIQRRKGHKVDPQEIFRLLKDVLPEQNQIHGGIFFVDSFPMTPSGKVNRAKVRDQALTSPRILPK
ncbi:Luciferase [Operophtera brumata]|uniref:Luciferase n=1 Tax=Operophtera brumata TaxID=104452 RepID=A0A0L7L7I1_OPEBR|nr:Luciferase [Operophtera brumata]